MVRARDMPRLALRVAAIGSFKFPAAAVPGAVLEARARVAGRLGRLIKIEGEVTADGVLVASGSLTLQALEHWPLGPQPQRALTRILRISDAVSPGVAAGARTGARVGPAQCLARIKRRDPFDLHEQLRPADLRQRHLEPCHPGTAGDDERANERRVLSSGDIDPHVSQAADVIESLRGPSAGSG